ncbi:MAG: glutamyl-tRNA reductase [Chloroflexota bacterium]|nr:glutamyl-tRNA reductase [Chloroflexota bacterium]
MELIVVGLNYKTAPVELREKLSFSKHSLPDVLHQMSQLFPEGVILSTCNRTEIYTLVEDRQMGYTLLADFLSSTHNVPIRDFLPHLYSSMGDKAARHLFNVTSGIDSMILGEPQILGQVRNAFMQAQEAETVGKYLSLLFRCALHAGKRVRSETGIAQGAASVSHATIEIARQTLESLSGSHVALIGAGEMGKHLALCLKDAGCTQFTIVSHSFNHAQELADTYEARALEFEALDQALLEADLALTLLESPTIIIDRPHAEEIARQRQGKELYLVDIAVPRNIAPEVALVPGITLFDIDDLQSVVDTNLEQRQQEMEHIEQILAEELDDFNEQWRSTMVAPVITALRQKAEDIRQGELAKMLPKLQHLSDKELNTVQTLTTRIVNKLLHEPVVDLRSKGDPEHAALISELFLLTVGEPDGEQPVAEYKGSGLATS